MASKIAGLYDMENTLGSGHFAVVKSARHVFTGLRVAIKVIDKLKLDEVSRTHLYQEVRCMKLVTHPSIIRLYEVIDTQTKLYLIQELGDGGDLYDFIMKHPSGVAEDIARRIFKQTVSAIRYCHKLHVVHRDLKPENLVFCTDSDQSGQRAVPRVKLTDFGLSRTFLPGELIESSCGSLEYSAPEILLGDSYDPPKIDVWSLGVILFMLITGHSPFAYGGAGEILARIMDGKYHCPPQVSSGCRNLIGVMLVVDSQRRASLEEVASHQWLQEGEGEEDVPLTAISNVDEIPQPDLDVILRRMEQGGYGSMEAIMRLLKEKPYGSTAATFYLLAEAERHRKYARSHTTPTRVRKASMTSPFSSTPNGPFGVRLHGSVESGFLRHHNTTSTMVTSPTATNSSMDDLLVPLRRKSDDRDTANTEEATPTKNSAVSNSFTPTKAGMAGQHLSFASPQTALSSPYSSYHSSSPRSGVAGEQRSLLQTPKPAFPLNVQSLNIQPLQENEFWPTPEILSHRQSVPTMAPLPLQPPALPMENIDYSPYIGLRSRALSVFEEESETESVTELPQLPPRQPSSSPSHGSSPRNPSSPRHSPRSRSRWLANATSSPNLFGSVSKSDASDDEEDEEDDDIVELMTTSGRFPSKCSTFPRLSPGNSPLLTSRRSPTHYLTGSSDEELHSVFESTRKHRSKRLAYRKRSAPLVPMDSISSDDGLGHMEFKQPTRKDRLLRLRHTNSLPATPAENSASESLTDLLDNLRRNRSGSCRTDSSLSDGGGEGGGDGGGDSMCNLSTSMAAKFDFSDEETTHVAMETDPATKNGGLEVKRTGSTTLRSVFCSIL